MDTLWHDLRYALRMLRRSPAFAVIALFSLALGIGANTAIFSVINAMLLRSLPVQRPEQLALLTTDFKGLSFSYPLYERFRDNKKCFTDVLASAGANRMHMVVADEGAAAQSDLVKAERVSGNYFNVLGVKAERGRTLDENDDRRNDAQAVVVISYDVWKERFNLNTDAVGKRITLNDFPFTIIGVAPEHFTGVELGAKPDLWLPLWITPQVNRATSGTNGSIMESQTTSWLRVIGRLNTASTFRQAQTEMDGILQQNLIELAESRKANWTPSQRQRFFDRKIGLEPGGVGFSYLRLEFTRPLWLLMIIVGVVLLIACANVANLLLARAASRQREIAIRLSIGASRLRLIRQLLTESVLLAVAGGALGVIFARWVTSLLVAYVVNGKNDLSFDLSPDLRVLMFTISVSVVTGIVFGLAPALRATKIDLTPTLKETAGNVSGGRSRIGIDRVLMVTQVALSLFLLIGAGLFVRSLQNLRNVDAGFDSQNVLLFSLDTRPTFNARQRADIARQVLLKIESLPGTRSASLSSFSIISGAAWTSGVSVPGYISQPDEDMDCYTLAVGPRYFETMGIPVLLGRDFNNDDDRRRDEIDVSNTNDRINRQTAAIPVIINQTMAARFFRGDNPVGKQFKTGRPDNQANLEIVGVVKDAKYENLREKSQPSFYIPYLLTYDAPAFRSYAGIFQVRTVGNPLTVSVAIQQEIRKIDNDTKALDIRTMESMVDGSLVLERFIAQVASFFSLFALLLACMGLYGIMSYGVVRRRKEMGIRVALGAQPGGVVWLVLRQAVLMVLIGTAIGVPVSIATTRFASSYLFGLSATDPATIIGATLVLLTVAVLAGYLPARRASRIDPMVALRYE